MFERVALIGLGLIGSSLSHAMRRERLAGHIAGHVPDIASDRIEGAVAEGCH